MGYHQPGLTFDQLNVGNKFVSPGRTVTEADVVIRPDTGAMRGTDFDNRHQAINEGEKAGLAAIAAIKLKVAEKTVTVVTNR